MSILDSVNSSADIRDLSYRELDTLSSEIRDFLIENVTRTGGHLASNLGVVEATLAMHRVFDLERDNIIFDVGHQSYTHKILTGRKSGFSDMRRFGTMSGFTVRSESKYDSFGAGHSSTSISAALGFAEAKKLAGDDSFTVAFIGDGALTGGMAHEALNNCKKQLNLIIVLNENEMSISKNTGGFPRLIAKMRISKNYVRTKQNTVGFLTKIPLIGNFLFKATRKVKRIIKKLLVRNNYFEDLGFSYYGPADGNNIEQVELLLREAKRHQRVSIVHLKTKKGKGLDEAERNPMEYHSYYPKKPYGETFNTRFGSALCSLAERDGKVVAVTAAMGHGTGLGEFTEKYKSRFFDVGIAEEHALTFSAGLCASGMKAYFAVYSTFLQRGYDNIVHDIALQRLPVRICIDRAGLIPSDGATHHGIFDVAFLLSTPNMSVYAPATFGSMECMLVDSLVTDMPLAIRYSNVVESARIVDTFYPLSDYENYGVRTSDHVSDCESAVTIITYSKIADTALLARDELIARGITAQVILLEVLKPYDAICNRLVGMLPRSGKILFVEEGIKNGGAGMVLGEELRTRHAQALSGHEYKILAIDDTFALSNVKGDIYEFVGLDRNSIVNAALN